MISIGPNLSFDSASFFLLFKILLLILAGLHFAFTLFAARQVRLMTKSLVTPVGVVIKLLSTVYIIMGLLILLIFKQRSGDITSLYF